MECKDTLAFMLPIVLGIILVLGVIFTFANKQSHIKHTTMRTAIEKGFSAQEVWCMMYLYGGEEGGLMLCRDEFDHGGK
jgi:nitrate/nitrite transporter NarK